MTGDRNKFLTLKKEKYGSVSFDNNHSAKIIGRDTVNLGRKDAMEENVLLVEDTQLYLNPKSDDILRRHPKNQPCRRILPLKIVIFLFFFFRFGLDGHQISYGNRKGVGYPTTMEKALDLQCY
jgi:hypothetical protein